MVSSLVIRMLPRSGSFAAAACVEAWRVSALAGVAARVAAPIVPNTSRRNVRRAVAVATSTSWFGRRESDRSLTDSRPVTALTAAPIYPNLVRFCAFGGPRPVCPAAAGVQEDLNGSHAQPAAGGLGEPLAAA